MTTTSPIEITIEYLLTDNHNWTLVKLTPDDYFDIESDETITLDSLPKYNHAREYLNYEPHQIVTTKLTLRDDSLKTKRCIIERFWNQGKNRLIERSDLGLQSYWEMILEMEISQDPPLWEILRLGRENDIITPWYHGFIQDNEDGSQTETQVNIESQLSLVK